MTSVNSKIKHVFSIALALIIIASTFVITGDTASAASWPAISTSKPLKTYTISTGNNTTAYTTNALSAKKGTIYASDEVYIYSIGKNSSNKWYAYCSYPIKGGRKYAYIPLTAVTKATSPTEQGTSSASITTYRRASTSAKAGTIAKNDKVYKLTSSGNYTQVVYNIGSASNPTGWRMAWITTSSYNSYIKKANTTSSNSTAVSNNTTSLQMPMDNAYCTWRTPGNNMSWGQYTSNSSGRNYHLGLDIYGSNGNVKSTANGTVAAVGFNSANGNYVIIKHTISGKTTYSFYAHLKSYCVKANQNVSKGQQIGVAGNTGSSTSAVHLHFAMMDTLWSKGSYYGYATYFTGNKVKYKDVTYYNPYYVVKNGKLP